MIVKIILDILILLVLDIILSVDNAILITMATKDLEGKDKKIASLFGAMGAVLLRLIFVILLIFFLEILSNVPSIYFLGGLLLGYIGWTLTNEHQDDHSGVKSGTKILKAVAVIIAADMMMSFDNALIISEVVIGLEWGDVTTWTKVGLDITIVAIALLISLVLIVFSSNILGAFMKKNKWVVYVGCWLLLSVATEMILKDVLIHKSIEELFNGKHFMISFFSYWVGGIFAILNWWWRGRNNRLRI